MAGVMPNKRSSSGRKQWAIHTENAEGSLKRLRSQLAGEGCAESQLVLAKQLLGDQCATDEKEENDRLGVYWLMKASEQGNLEANTLLEMCFATSRGINDHNYLDVKNCIEMSRNEKVARRAAREMFATLSNGEDFITSQQLERRILTINRHREALENNTSSDEDYDDDLVVIKEHDGFIRRNNAEKLSEQQIVAAAVNYSHGQLPIIDRVINSHNLDVLERISIFHQSIVHPLLAFRILYYKLIRFLGRSRTWSIPGLKSDLQIVLLLLVYYTFNVRSLFIMLPIVVYYVSLFFMVVTTFQMLESKRSFSDFRVWSHLFITYSNGELNTEEAENQFCTKNLRPYGHFFIALLCNLITYPTVSDHIYQSELTIVAFALTLVTLLSFQTNLHTFLSFAIHILAKYPYETDQVTQSWFLDLETFTFPNLIGNSVEFYLHLRSFFYLLIPVTLIRLASTDNWTGTYKILIPHCVTLAWLQIVIISSQGATMFGLLRATLALVGVVCFLPCVSIAMILLPAFALSKWLTRAENLYTLGVFSGLTLLSLLLTYVIAKTRFGQQYVKVQFLLAFLAAVFLLKSHWHQSSLKVEPYFKSITWEQYENYCHQPAWERNQRKILTEFQCAELNGMEVEWMGYVHELRVKSVSNPIANLVNKLTPELNSYLTCTFGEKLPSDCLNENCKIALEILKGRRSCTLKKYNTYVFEINVELYSGIWGKPVEILLNVDDYFRNFTLELKPGDKIEFRGKLDEILGGEKITIQLNAIKCINCSNKHLDEMRLTNFDIGSVLSYAFIGFKFVLNILFNPILIFK